MTSGMSGTVEMLLDIDIVEDSSESREGWPNEPFIWEGPGGAY